MPGQTRYTFEIQNFLTETYLTFIVLSQDAKNIICFYVRQYKNTKIAIKKVTSSPLPGF